MGRFVLRMSVALAALLASFSIITAVASANRPYQTRFSQNAPGDLIVTGNSNETCPDATAGCADARNGVGTNAALLNNNNYVMQYVDADGDASTYCMT